MSAMPISRPCTSGSTSSKRSGPPSRRSEEHTSELQSRLHLVCRLLLEKKNSQLLSDSKSTPLIWNSLPERYIIFLHLYSYTIFPTVYTPYSTPRPLTSRTSAWSFLERI